MTRIYYYIRHDITYLHIHMRFDKIQNVQYFVSMKDQFIYIVQVVSFLNFSR